MKRLQKYLFFLMLCTFLFLAGCGAQQASNHGSSAAAELETNRGETVSGYLKVHFIDVGQGDSILIQCGDEAMLIDAGTNESESTVVQYLQQQGISRLSYVIGTHPHEDHIGGLDAVISSFDIDTVIMPDATHTTRTYEDVLDALLAKELSITLPNPGDSYRLGGASFTILSPSQEVAKEAAAEDDLNNLSVGIRLEYGATSFVMCGDAEGFSEEAMVESGLNLKADVLKVGHHGSSTSSSDAFLDSVDCTYAVISCGRDNSYGHPHQETLSKLNARDIQVLRTDESGTILAISDGNRLTWQTGDGESTSESQTVFQEDTAIQETAGEESGSEAGTNAETSYVLNTNTMKFHLPDCSSVEQMNPDNRMDYQGSRDALLNQGYSPCGICNP